MGYLTDYQSVFKNKTKKFFDKAQQYTQELLVSKQRNIEQISDSLAGADYFQLQHFITESKWDTRDAIDLTAKQTSKTLPKRKLSGLIIDETGTVKKGDKRVGVGWQYCGNVCKNREQPCWRNGLFK